MGHIWMMTIRTGQEDCNVEVMGLVELNMLELKNPRQTHQEGGWTPDKMSAFSLAWLCLLPLPSAEYRMASEFHHGLLLA
jgi:hypothetical protein